MTESGIRGTDFHEPYFSHSFRNDVHVLLGSTSKIFPSRGIPGGWGIGFVIAMFDTQIHRITQNCVNRGVSALERKRERTELEGNYYKHRDSMCRKVKKISSNSDLLARRDSDRFDWWWGFGCDAGRCHQKWGIVASPPLTQLTYPLL